MIAACREVVAPVLRHGMLFRVVSVVGHAAKACCARECEQQTF